MIEEAIAFLKNTPPFSLLDDDTLRSIASESLLEFQPKGHVIVRQEGPAAEHLGIIRSGGVKVFVRTNEGEEVVLDYRGGGDFFGFLSITCGEVSRNTVVAAEDTSYYLVRKETVLGLLRSNPDFSEYFLRSFLGKLADITYSEIHDRTLLYGGGDKLLFTSTVGDLARGGVETSSQDIPIREAARVMSERGVSSLVLLDSDGFPTGIVTDRDLRHKVVARGRDLSDSVRHIMSVTLLKTDERDYCFEALLKMIRYNVHHLLVVSKGEIKGIITGHDLMMLQGTAPLSVAREIEKQTSIDGLVPVAKKINRIITLLIQEGARASNVTRIITEVNDRLLRKVLGLVEKRLGPPPVGYCWIVFGSEGRKEQTFRTDQDNALIYQDPPRGGEEESRTYFSEFAGRAREALMKCGFPPCPADFMASNPKWCQPLSVWQGYFSKWIATPTPEAVLLSLIFFDFRPVYGEVVIAERLRAFLAQKLRSQKMFFGHMAGLILGNRPPLGLMGRFALEKRGDHKDTFNIKFRALCPIVDAARLSALEMGILQTSTIERLRELKERYSTIGALSADLEEAFEFLASLRLRHQFGQIQAGEQPDNFIDPRRLTAIERRTLQESFRIVLRAQEAIRKQYGDWIT